MKKFQLFVIGFLTLGACTTVEKDESTSNYGLQYAKGFRIQDHGNSKSISIIAPYQGAEKIATYTFSKTSDSSAIKVPIERIVATSTTHIPMIELLKEAHAIVGFANTSFISSEKTRNRIELGFIKEVGIKGNLNTEILLDLKPEAIISYAVNAPEKSLDLLERAGIPVIYNGDWLEKTPLGKAEWIKFFGVLFNKEQLADSIFKSIEKSYQTAKSLAKSDAKVPTILSGAIMNNDIWNLPAGNSYVAQFLRDANTNYLWQDSQGQGSLNLSFESVFEQAKHADYWIAPGYFSSKTQMLQANKLYGEFDAFKRNQIYTPTLKKGATGGVLYYELATVRPDLVLKDLIKITHPTLLPDYELTFFEKMK